MAAHGAAWVTGLQSTGVAASAKHFPGHGDTAQDSHVALPVIDRSLDDLRQRELVPFVAAIEAGVRVIMTAHIMLPQLDAGPSAGYPRVYDIALETISHGDGQVDPESLARFIAERRIPAIRAAVQPPATYAKKAPPMLKMAPIRRSFFQST